jgi:DNA-binding LytR/AlgR family response regulator
MRALIVDDELPARRRLRTMLEETDEIGEVVEAESAVEALALVEQTRPHLLLLDIHMPGVDGLELAATPHLPPVIFVTAHDEYALKAFDVGAVDYLLKPVRPERLAEALARAKAREHVGTERWAASADGNRDVPRIITHKRGTVGVFDARAISRFWSSDKYTLFRHGGTEHLTEEPLSMLATRLTPWGFLRVHRSELIRVAAVRAISWVDRANEVRLDDGQVARVSRRLVCSLKNQLGIRTAPVRLAPFVGNG